MEAVETSASTHQPNTLPVKESIRDMIQLQRDYQLSDELFWEIFNTRVLLNENVNIDDFLDTY